MIAIAPTHLIYIHRLGELYTFWCGAIVLSVPKGNARSPRNRIKQIVFPHLIFYRLSIGNRWAQQEKYEQTISNAYCENWCGTSSHPYSRSYRSYSLRLFRLGRSRKTNMLYYFHYWTIYKSR